MPTPPLPLAKPSSDRFRSVTTSLEPATIAIASILTPTATATPGPPSIVIVLSMVRLPKSPGPSASISPKAFVFRRAPANVRHGDVWLQGFTSFPVADTQVRGLCAAAGDAARPTSTNAAGTQLTKDDRIMTPPPQARGAR